MSHRRKESLLKSWGSGTGMAGIAGAGYSFITRFTTISNFWSFIGVSPVVIIYGVVFYLILDKSPDEDGFGEDPKTKPLMEEFSSFRSEP
jgi:hypothetical protein